LIDSNFVVLYIVALSQGCCQCAYSLGKGGVVRYRRVVPGLSVVIVCQQWSVVLTIYVGTYLTAFLFGFEFRVGDGESGGSRQPVVIVPICVCGVFWAGHLFRVSVHLNCAPFIKGRMPFTAVGAFDWVMSAGFRVHALYIVSAGAIFCGVRF